jgi:transcription antitermination factor NusG
VEHYTAIVEGEQMTQHWYALRSKPRKEALLWQHAQSRGFEIFYPRIPVKRANPRARPVAPYFPGYMFVRTNLAEVGVSVFAWMPNALGLVSFGGEPAEVDTELIDAVRRQVYAIADAGGELFHGLKKGDPVLIKAGPFAGYEAIFDGHASGADRVRVLLELLNDRQVAVELGAGQLQRR